MLNDRARAFIARDWVAYAKHRGTETHADQMPGGTVTVDDWGDVTPEMIERMSSDPIQPDRRVYQSARRCGKSLALELMEAAKRLK